MWRTGIVEVLILLLWQPTLTKALAGGGPSENSAPSLCRADEQAFFACSIARSTKIVSLCGSRYVDHRRGYVQYRYGNPGAIELQFPQARANTQRVFRYAHYFRAGVERTEISFDHQDYRYTVFDYYEGDTKPATVIAGVRVSKHGATQTETELLCQGKALNKLGRLETFIAADADNPLNR
jgi:hypothetical protein